MYDPDDPAAGASPAVWNLIVEGESEKRYFDYLQELIWAHPDMIPVEIRSVISQAPASFVRTYLRRRGDMPAETDVYFSCVADVEGDHPAQIRIFEKRLADLKAASEIDPEIAFSLAYSNCDFELWMILHKIDFYRTVLRKEQYLKPLREAFGDVRSLANYKRKKTFARILRQISLGDVEAAVRRSDAVEMHRRREGPPQEYCGYTYYRKNPALSVGHLVRQILESARGTG